jgi:hypothetical protein
MTIQFEIKDAIINDQLCTALEGGSNYWYMIGQIDRKHFVKGDTIPDNLVRSFLADKDFYLEVYDLESEDEDNPDLLGKVTYESMQKAFSIMSKDYPVTLGSILSGDYDADDSDIWFQIATMGEVVYG